MLQKVNMFGMIIAFSLQKLMFSLPVWKVKGERWEGEDGIIGNGQCGMWNLFLIPNSQFCITFPLT